MSDNIRLEEPLNNSVRCYEFRKVHYFTHHKVYEIGLIDVKALVVIIATPDSRIQIRSCPRKILHAFDSVKVAESISLGQSSPNRKHKNVSDDRSMRGICFGVGVTHHSLRIGGLTHAAPTRFCADKISSKTWAAVFDAERYILVPVVSRREYCGGRLVLIVKIYSCQTLRSNGSNFVYWSFSTILRNVPRILEARSSDMWGREGLPRNIISIASSITGPWLRVPALCFRSANRS